MKMNGQSRTFVKQVKLDLLALCDADLSHIIHQWVDGRNSSGIATGVPEETFFALGYTRVLSETESLPQPGSTNENSASWHAPSPHHLRALITAMDEQKFVQHVITFAFQSLHPIYPEWYDGLTFNAHLANYLRQINTKRRAMTIKQSI